MIALNEGVIDRTIRVVIGALLLLVALTIRGGGWAYIGLIPLITGTIGYCPIYSAFGISTYEDRESAGEASVTSIRRPDDINREVIPLR